MAEADDRKKRIMEHVARSKGTFNKDVYSGSPERKQQILDHVRRTTG
ncbi:hypothetical protein H6G89_01820 [Oscillatoria sp. FACHB-1407]|nr:hypothetical protein [Oscillatoria sp. FACHB-1407]MBD2459770.1 hypothetical protein [Oscillatoria sp. FACHB-1407]